MFHSVSELLTIDLRYTVSIFLPRADKIEFPSLILTQWFPFTEIWPPDILSRILSSELKVFSTLGNNDVL